MLRLIRIVAALALTAAAGAAFPAPPASRAQALSALEGDDTVHRAEAVVWIAEHGRMEDTQRLAARLRDESPLVRDAAEQALWRLWSRSGDEAVDRLLARGAEAMEAGRYPEAIGTFSEVIRRRPEFAEGWNKRATAYFLSGRLDASRADCDEVLRRNPQHFGALAGYGLIYFRQADYENAIAWWQRALEVNPNMAGVAANMAQARALLRDRRARTI
ncbi:MAG TPA: tetratricopeptide repeat protein [Burkholderiales bacterium]|nr:tetratricopeptide repeat protein [Burkholderiales bacterium]